MSGECCSICGNPVRTLRTSSGRMVVIDPDPVEDGTVTIATAGEASALPVPVRVVSAPSGAEVAVRWAVTPVGQVTYREHQHPGP